MDVLATPKIAPSDSEIGEDANEAKLPAGTQALPVDTNPLKAANQLERTTSKAVEPDDISKSPVRSSTPKPNRNEYHRVNMRKWRAAKKAKRLN